MFKLLLHVKYVNNVPLKYIDKFKYNVIHNGSVI